MGGGPCVGPACTVTTTSSAPERAPSDAVSRRTKTPGASKDADVDGEAGSANVATPGPLTFDQAAVSVPPGRPSSLIDPASAASLSGRVSA